MSRTMVGQVTDAERNEILRLHERRTALAELRLTLGSPYLSPAERDVLEKRIDEDQARTDALFDGWWRVVQAEHHLHCVKGGRWLIDFQTKALWHEPPVGQPEGCGSCDACATCPDGASHPPPCG